MKYSSGAAFRQALQTRILTLHNDSGIPITRIRKVIAFERFLARLLFLFPGSWVLKGGMMMELQFQHRARTTKDIDLLVRNNKIDLHPALINTGKFDLRDWFGFEVGKPFKENHDQINTVRFNVTSLLDSRTFESFHVDINHEDILVQDPVLIKGSRYLDFAGIEPIRIPCYPLAQQIAEKLHALTAIHQSGEVSRVKDLVDILVIAGNRQLPLEELRRAIQSTFEHRKKHGLPVSSPRIAAMYSRNFSSLAKQVGLKQKSLNEANIALEEFLLPVISGSMPKTWNPKRWKWE